MNDHRGRLRVHHAASLPANLIAAVLLAGSVLACAPAAPSAAPTAVPTPSPTAVATLPPTEPAITPSPLPAATAAAGPSPCLPADLKASHGLVQGAAGSRIAEVILVSAVACSIDAFPALGLRDAANTALLSAPSSGPGRLDLVAGGAYTSNVRLANWCAAQPAFPLTLEIIFGAEELPVGGGSFPENGDLPPCNGGGGPILEGTTWTATP